VTGRPSNEYRRLNRHDLCSRVQLHAERNGIDLAREIAADLVAQGGDPLARLEKFIEAKRRSIEAARRNGR
jgi:hypothetical protein